MASSYRNLSYACQYHYNRMKFSSPFRESRNSQAQSTQQQYEEEFWKIKAQRLQAKNAELTKENQELIKKSIQSSKREQELIDKLAAQSSLDRSRSRRKDQKDKQTEAESAARDQIERLGKQIRVLKNQHSLEITKSSQQCKRLKKKVAELQARLISWVSGDDYANKVRALTEEIATLTKRQTISEQQLDRFREEKKKLLSDIDVLSKEVSMMKAREKAAQKQEEENLMDLHRYERFIHQYKAEKEESPPPSNPAEGVLNVFQHSKQASNEINRLRKEVQALEKQRQSNRKLLLDISTWEHDKSRTEARIKQMECELSDNKSELKNVLTKLSPLLSQKAQFKGKENIEAKASLTLLEIFLKKYKIQAF